MAATERISHTEEPIFGVGGAPKAIYDTTWAAQTFTTDEGFFITRVDVFIEKIVATPGTVTVEIRKTSGGEPVGSALASKSLNGNDFSTDFEWVTFTLDSSVELLRDNVYAIVISCPDGEWLEMIQATQTETPGDTGYDDGTLLSSPDSGSNWTIAPRHDILFKTWGNDASYGIFSPPLPSGMTLTFDEAGDPVYSGTPTGKNNMMTIRRLAAVSNSKFWYEDI